MTILVAEDDRDDQFMIKRAFEKVAPGVDLHFADNGRQAIAYMAGEGEFHDRNAFPYPSLIITDLKMPVADGFAVLEQLKSHPSWQIIPRIVFSASEDSDDVKRAYLLGASAYHTKPSSTDDLRHQIEVIYRYWLTCKVPNVDATGEYLPTHSEGKLGERFAERV